MIAKKNRKKTAKERDWPDIELSLTPTPVNETGVLELELDKAVDLDGAAYIEDWGRMSVDDIVWECTMAADVCECTSGFADPDGLEATIVGKSE